jgi:ribosomal protein S18 acetylase RimI-like enzyme
MMTIREIQLNDAQEYYRLREASEREFPQYVGLNGERELLAGPQKIAALLSSYGAEGITAWGAFSQDSLAAIACVTRKKSPKYQHKGFIWGMYVGTDWRGQKLGQRLVRHIIEWGRAEKLQALRLQVSTTNTPAIKLYEADGFVTYGHEKKSLFAGGAYHDVYLMELALP